MSEFIESIIRFLRSIFGSGEDVESDASGEGRQDAGAQKPLDECYYKKVSLLSKVENAWYANAMQALGGNAVICPKVRVEDVTGVKKGLGRSGAATARNRIKSRHFDFVICNKGLAPLAVVEIDDSSHTTSKGKAQDELKNSLCEAVSLPIIRFKSTPTATQEEIRDAVFKAVRG